MANGTSGHESEFINVQDLKAALQKFKTDKVDVKVNTSTTVNGHALSSNVTVTKSDVGLGSVGNFKAVSTVASQGLTDTEKSNARANIGAGTSSFSGSYNDLTNKPSIPAAVAVKGNAETSYRTGNVNITPANIGLGNVGNFKAVSTVASQGLSATEKSNARANIGAGTSSFSGSYSDLSNKPTIPSVVQTTGNSTTSVMSQKAVTDYVQSVLVNPISDSSILVNTEFSPRDVISVDGEMYMADAATSDLPKTNPVVQDSKIVTQDGKVVLGFSSTTSADWHSF